jgi:carbon-monoxide dehydrogenase small subunit
MLEAMSGHLCRCTGYQGIRKAIDKLAEAGTSGGRA